MPKIYDCFTFFNELDLLTLRLSELESVVDAFVIVEADHSFAGRRKPYLLNENWDRLKRWQHKIKYFRVELKASGVIEDEAQRFEQESQQRNAINHAVGLLDPADDDIALISDVDEIWRPAVTPRICDELGRNRFCWPILWNYRGYINNASQSALNGKEWIGPVACRVDTLRVETASAIRRVGGSRVLEDEPRDSSYISNGGWHFSSMGGPQAFWIKAQNFSHVEDPYRVVRVPAADQEIRVVTTSISRDECHARQRQYIDYGGDIAFSPMTFDDFEIKQDVPDSLVTNKERYRGLFFFTDCVTYACLRALDVRVR